MPLVVVLDNASIHISHLVKEAQPALAAEGIRLFYLPPYSPKLNALEPYFGGIKYHDLPERRYLSLAELAQAADQAFERVEARVLAGRPEHGSEINIIPG